MVRVYLRQIVCGVLHLHRNGLVHNRLNLHNIVHDGEGKVQVNWLESSKSAIFEQEKKRHFYFFPPEALLSRNYLDSAMNDVWAIGCMALQLQLEGTVRYSSFHPYNRDTRGWMSESGDILRKVQQLMGSIGLPLPDCPCNEEKKSMSVLGIEFVSLCLTVHLERRASLAQLLSHPYLTI